jgi:hypothetical protein
MFETARRKAAEMQRITTIMGVLAGIAAVAPAAEAAQVSYDFHGTGDERAFTVPEGVGLLTVDAVGGSGERGVGGAAGGYGARVAGTIPVLGGRTYFVQIGVGGGSAVDSGRGGGWSAFARCRSTAQVCSGFGSALQSRLVVAGGGGGGGASIFGGAGGDAGMPGRLGVTPTNVIPRVLTSGGGGAGTLSAGGAGGAAGDPSARAGNDGRLGFGGDGVGPGWPSSDGPGGGGGWYGGGAGGSTGVVSGRGLISASGGGGGGSSYITGLASNTSAGLTGPHTDPSVTITLDDRVAPRVAIGGADERELRGSAGTDTGDLPDVRVRFVDRRTVATIERDAVAAQDGSWRVSLDGLPEGRYDARASQSDRAGNARQTDAVAVTVDRPDPPQPPQPPQPKQPAPQPTPDLSAPTAERGQTPISGGGTQISAPTVTGYGPARRVMRKAAKPKKAAKRCAKRVRKGKKRVCVKRKARAKRAGRARRRR